MKHKARAMDSGSALMELNITDVIIEMRPLTGQCQDSHPADEFQPCQSHIDSHMGTSRFDKGNHDMRYARRTNLFIK